LVGLAGTEEPSRSLSIASQIEAFMTQQIPLSSDARADSGDSKEGTLEIAPDLAYQRHTIVNVGYWGRPGAGARNWVLIDAGIMGSMRAIEKAATERFGPGARSSAIVLTHGHFDHVGVLEDLAEKWDVPVYAHVLEAPYLNGRASYPPPDPSVGGGAIALSSPLFPRSPVNVGNRLQLLPEDGSVPPMPGWRWLHTPGHAPGHVSFWRAADRSLIVGDAFVTTAQESAYAVAMQEPEIHGPPMYFTPEWDKAGDSVRKLAALEPELVVTGHGRAMRGEPMRAALRELALRFEDVAVPQGGKYTSKPARAEDGTAYR
jgi:glyoxylase-like metal-dependent hydrolase (beta-lactamase superfamily II)